MRQDVHDANAISDFVATVMSVCHALRVWYVVEQPATSMLWQYAPIAQALQHTGARRVYLELGRAGGQSAKGVVLWGTAPWLEAVARKVQRQPMVAEPEPLATRQGCWVNGNHNALQGSAQYPPPFCNTVAGAHADYLAHRPGTGQFFRQLAGIDDSIGPILVEDED